MKCVVRISVLPAALSCFRRSQIRWRPAVEAGGRFVEKDNVRVIDQRAGQGQAPFHATGERCDAGIRLAAEAGEIEQGRDSSLDVGIAQAEIAAEDEQVFGAGEIRVEVVELRHDTDPRPCLLSVGRNGTPFSVMQPLSGAVSPRQRRKVVVLPAPFGPSSPKQVPVRRRTTAGDHGLVAIGLAQVADV
jgi:hypothetical protein